MENPAIRSIEAEGRPRTAGDPAPAGSTGVRPAPARRRPAEGRPPPVARPLLAAALGLALAPSIGADRAARAQDGDLFIGGDSVGGDSVPVGGATRPALAGDGPVPPAGAAAAAPAPDAPADAATPQTVGAAAAGPRDVRGLVEPRAEAVLSAEIAGRLTDLPVEEGAAFAAGDVLAAFDCALYEAQLNQAEAAALAARRQLANNRQLAQYNSIGALEVALSEAAVLEAQATVEVAQVIVDRCTVTAPWDGVMAAHLAQAQESVGEGADLVAILAAAGEEIDLIVPSAWLAWLAPGQPFDFAVDELGSSHRAVVERLGARVDPVSQTVRVTGRFADPPGDLIPGMSGTARFRAPAAAADDAGMPGG